MTTARAHLAWLIWCFNEEYVTAEDREILTNWIEYDPAVLEPRDRALRACLLTMADEVLAALEAEAQ